MRDKRGGARKEEVDEKVSGARTLMVISWKEWHCSVLVRLVVSPRGWPKGRRCSLHMHVATLEVMHNRRAYRTSMYTKKTRPTFQHGLLQSVSHVSDGS